MTLGSNSQIHEQLEVFLLDKDIYKAIDREARLKAALHSSSYKKCHEMLQAENPIYTSEEKRRIRDAIRENRSYVLIGDERYPEKLYDMAWPPLILFYEGDLDLLHRPSAGIVGSRSCSSYGRRSTGLLSKALSKIGMVIVSGGARGVDSTAHRAALEESGKTVCVLGCGLDISYPRENAHLFSRIREEGLVISEYPRGFGPAKWTFPMRNRIIAALSDAIIVTEAAEKSGSLHTAAFGEEINRPVYAVPHEIFSTGGMGSNALLEMGARILYRKETLIRDLISEHPQVLQLRIKDLSLLDLQPGLQELEKIFGLESDDDSSWKKSLCDLVRK
jgi:DNA processing protein